MQKVRTGRALCAGAAAMAAMTAFAYLVPPIMGLQRFHLPPPRRPGLGEGLHLRHRRLSDRLGDHGARLPNLLAVRPFGLGLGAGPALVNLLSHVVWGAVVGWVYGRPVPLRLTRR